MVIAFLLPWRVRGTWNRHGFRWRQRQFVLLCFFSLVFQWYSPSIHLGTSYAFKAVAFRMVILLPSVSLEIDGSFVRHFHWRRGPYGKGTCVILLLSVSMEINRPFIRHSHWRRGLMGKVGLVFTHSYSYLCGMSFTFRSFVDFVYIFVLEYRKFGLAYAYWMHRLLLMLEHPRCRIPTAVVSDVGFSDYNYSVIYPYLWIDIRVEYTVNLCCLSSYLSM